MKENTCNYSDEWQPYINDYDKFEYDVKLKDGRIIENCYPNAQLFNVLDSNDAYPEADVAEIRFSANPKSLLNNKHSAATIRPYLKMIGLQYTNPYSTLDLNMDIITPRTPKHIGKLVEVRTTPKIGRNEPCTCGSGKKYKKCCIDA